MNVREQPILNFVFSRAIFLAVGAFLLGAGILTLFKQQGNWLFGGSLVLLGACALFVALKSAAEAFRGKPILEQVVSLPLPGRAIWELTVPTQMSKGSVILFFGDTTERYAGTIRLSKEPPDKTSPVSVNLERLEPSRIKVPQWSPTSDAGEVVETWPRRTGQSADPVVLEFSFPVQDQQKLRLEFELESNFKGTKLESRFPITGKETVRVVLKE